MQSMHSGNATPALAWQQHWPPLHCQACELPGVDAQTMSVAASLHTKHVSLLFHVKVTNKPIST